MKGNLSVSACAATKKKKGEENWEMPKRGKRRKKKNPKTTKELSTICRKAGGGLD